MKQIALDIGVSVGPSLANFYPGHNAAALAHLELWMAGAVMVVEMVEPKEAARGDAREAAKVVVKAAAIPAAMPAAFAE